MHYTNILGIGEPGTGKTHLINSIPGNVKVWEFDDKGADILNICKCSTCTRARTNNLKRDIVEIRETSKVRLGYGLTKPTRAKLIETELNKWLDGEWKDYDYLCIDGLTGLNQAMEDYSLQLNPDHKGIAGAPAQHHHMGTMVMMDQILRPLMGVPRGLYVTGHIDFITSEVTGEVRAVPMMTGKRRFSIGKDFREVWFCVTELSKDGPKWKLQVLPNRLYKAKTTMGGSGTFDMFEEPDFNYLLKKAGLSQEQPSAKPEATTAQAKEV